jgi:heme O synthase-like polyprenyltransferase
MGGGFLVSALGFWRTPSVVQARHVLRVSLVFLPAILTVLLVERVFK